jgi:hypothetical protein
MAGTAACACAPGLGCRACADQTPRPRRSGRLAGPSPRGGPRDNQAPRRVVSDLAPGARAGTCSTVLSLDPWDSMPGSTRLALTADRFQTGDFYAANGQDILASIDDRDIPFDVVLPDDVADFIVPYYEAGRFTTGSHGFVPRLEYSRYLSGSKTYKITSRFRDYVDYCSWVPDVLTDLDERLPLYRHWDAVWDPPRRSEGWEVKADAPASLQFSGDVEQWGARDVFDRWSFLFHSLGLLRRTRQYIRRGGCCDRDYQDAIRQGEGFEFIQFFDDERVEKEGGVASPWPVEPPGMLGEQPGSKGKTWWGAGMGPRANVQLNPYFVDAWTELANYWVHAASTLYAFARTWSAALRAHPSPKSGQNWYQYLLAQADEAQRIAVSCAVPVATTLLHEIIHAIGPNGNWGEGHLRVKCCQQVVAFKWAAMVMHYEDLAALGAVDDELRVNVSRVPTPNPFDNSSCDDSRSGAEYYVRPSANSLGVGSYTAPTIDYGGADADSRFGTDLNCE